MKGDGKREGEKWDEGEKKEEVKRERERSGTGRGVGWGIGSGGRREEWEDVLTLWMGVGMNIVLLRVCSLF